METRSCNGAQGSGPGSPCDDKEGNRGCLSRDFFCSVSPEKLRSSVTVPAATLATAAAEIPAVIRSHAALPPAGATTLAAAAPAMVAHPHADALAPAVVSRMHEHRQTMLLLVGKARIERPRRIG